MRNFDLTGSLWGTLTQPAAVRGLGSEKLLFPLTPCGGKLPLTSWLSTNQAVLWYNVILIASLCGIPASPPRYYPSQEAANKHVSQAAEPSTSCCVSISPPPQLCHFSWFFLSDNQHGRLLCVKHNTGRNIFIKQLYSVIHLFKEVLIKISQKKFTPNFCRHFCPWTVFHSCEVLCSFFQWLTSICI